MAGQRRHSPKFSTMSDYLVCLHTCETCICDMTMTILWPKNHGSIQHHAINPNRHPFCTADCPGNIYLLKNSVKDMRDSRAVRLPTKQEYEDNVTMELHGSGQLIDSGTGVSSGYYMLLIQSRKNWTRFVQIQIIALWRPLFPIVIGLMSETLHHMFMVL